MRRWWEVDVEVEKQAKKRRSLLISMSAKRRQEKSKGPPFPS